MTAQEIADAIYSFEGNADEWLKFEEKMNKEMENLSERDIEFLIETEAAEHLLMICDGIRFEQQKQLDTTHSIKNGWYLVKI